MFEYSVHNRVVPRRASVGTLNLYVVMVRVRVERNPEGQTPSNILSFTVILKLCAYLPLHHKEEYIIILFI